MRIANRNLWGWLICVALSALCIAAAQDHPYTGSFKNEKLSLSLTAQGDGYLGQIDEGYDTYRLSCKPEDGKLVGSFINTDGNSFPFSATLAGDQLTFSTGDTHYQLNRDRASGNPLIHNGRNPFDPPTTDPATTKTATTLPATLPSVTQTVMGIGVQFQNVDGKFHVANLMVKSPAAEAGLQIGDLLLEIDGTPPGPLENPADRIRIGSAAPAHISVERNGKRLEFNVQRQPMNFSTWSAVDSVLSRPTA